MGPAPGFHALTLLYTPTIALLTRRNVWRSALIDAVARQRGERLRDVGCGAGSLAFRLAVPEHGADPYSATTLLVRLNIFEECAVLRPVEKVRRI